MELVAGSASRQEALESLLDKIVERTDFPILAEHIHELMLSMRGEETSLRQVTNIILKDLGLALRILRTANSVEYNRSGKPILAVVHAVSLLGFDAIRDLATGFLLLRNYHTRSPGLKELMLLSLLTANHARAAAAHAGYPRWEEAYLCGMFRNLGEVLVACYFPQEYAAILVDMAEKKCTDRPATIRVLGCTYEELGKAAAERWKISDKAVACMEGAAQPGRKPQTDLDWLQALASFSHDLTAAIHRHDPKGARALVNHLLENYGPVLGLNRDQIQKISEVAIAETKATFEMLRVPLDDLRLRKQTDIALAVIAEGPAQTEDELRPAEAAAAENLLDRLTLEVESILTSGQDFDLNHVVLMALEAIYRGAGFDRVLFCLVSPEHTEIQARLGLGEGAESLIAKFRFGLPRRTQPLGALVAKQDVFVYRSMLGDPEFTAVVQAPCFGIYPVSVAGVLVGCLYFDRQSPVAPLEGRVASQISKLRDLVEAAILSKRS